jgi:hypothetical protein
MQVDRHQSPDSTVTAPARSAAAVPVPISVQASLLVRRTVADDTSADLAEGSAVEHCTAWYSVAGNSRSVWLLVRSVTRILPVWRSCL